MAKIIKRDTNKKVEKIIEYEVWETQCDCCGCVFEAEQGEFIDQCGMWTIICPQCGRFLDPYRWIYSKKKKIQKTIQVYPNELFS